MTSLSIQNAQQTLQRRLPWLVAGAAVLVFSSWLLNTPEGVLGKADAVGYAVCHRIDLRSFHLGDRQLPLCARCTGIYLGALLSLVVLGRKRLGALPPRWIVVVLIGFIGVMAFDGVNSYLTFFPGLPHLYEPQNGLRLVTGTFDGLAVGAMIAPVFNQTLWARWENRPALAGPRDLLGLVGGGLVLIGLVLTDNPVVLYPLAILSSVGVVALLTVLDTVILLVIARRENRAEGWAGAVLPVTAGLVVAILQIGLIDAVRFAIFGSWSGFDLPG